MLLGKTAIIPIFPLSLVVFPGESLPLHIFEPRYREMIAYCRKEKEAGRPAPFGLSFANEQGVSRVGCALRLDRVVQTYEDGRLDILTAGVRRYVIEEVLESGPYHRAQISYFEDEPEAFDMELREKASRMHFRLVELVANKTPSVELDPAKPASFLLAKSAGLGPEQKLKFLSMTSENQRITLLLDVYQQVLAMLKEAEEIKQRIRANGYFRRLSPQKIKCLVEF